MTTERRYAVRRRRVRRNIAATAVLLSVAAAAYVLLLGTGAVRMSPLDVIDVLTGGGTAPDIRVVWDLRLPVALATVIVGACLGVAGAWTQTMTRNPLASPDVLGIGAGASVAVVAGTVAGSAPLAPSIPAGTVNAVLALLGAGVIVVLLLLLGGFGATNRVVLIGFALSLMCHAMVSYLIARADILHAAEAQIWLAGSTSFVRTGDLAPLVAGLVPFLSLGICCSRDLPILAHDDDSAVSLGVPLRRRRAMLLIAATGVVAVVVSVVGPIGFVALVAPHIARLVSRAPLPAPFTAAAAGAAVLSVCALVAGLLPVAAPVGVVTSALGGVVLVVLILRSDTGVLR